MDLLYYRAFKHFQHCHNKETQRQFTKILKDAQPFVLHYNEENRDLRLDSDNLENLLSMPFNTISLEIHNKGDLVPILSFENDDLGMYGMVVNETSPGKYEFLITQSNVPFNVTSSFITHYIGPEHASNNAFLHCLNNLLGEINKKTNKIGTEKVKKYVKVSKHEKHKINRVIHICSKDLEYVPSLQKGRHVNWSHAWSVRGHWRKVETIGKDREGIYQVIGFTFVREHVKGEGDEVVKKIRVKK